MNMFSLFVGFFMYKADAEWGWWVVWVLLILINELSDFAKKLKEECFPWKDYK